MLHNPVFLAFAKAVIVYIVTSHVIITLALAFYCFLPQHLKKPDYPLGDEEPNFFFKILLILFWPLLLLGSAVQNYFDD